MLSHWYRCLLVFIGFLLAQNVEFKVNFREMCGKVRFQTRNNRLILCHNVIWIAIPGTMRDVILTSAQKLT